MTHNDNFVYLTLALVLLLLGTALSQQFFEPSAQHLMQSATVITLIVAVWGVDSTQLVLRRAYIFPLAIVGTAILGFWLESAGFDRFRLLLLLAFFISTALKTAKQVMFTGNVDNNKILGAICLYLLMGLIWAILFTLLQLSYPHSFQTLATQNEWYTLFPDFIYFSFVTLTTLGYGDIAPILPLARFLAYLEAIIGQLYLAILVASLVGSRINMHRK